MLQSLRKWLGKEEQVAGVGVGPNSKEDQCLLCTDHLCTSGHPSIMFWFTTIFDHLCSLGHQLGWLVHHAWVLIGGGGGFCSGVQCIINWYKPICSYSRCCCTYFPYNNRQFGESCNPGTLIPLLVRCTKSAASMARMIQVICSHAFVPHGPACLDDTHFISM